MQVSLASANRLKTATCANKRGRSACFGSFKAFNDVALYGRAICTRYRTNPDIREHREQPSHDGAGEDGAGLGHAVGAASGRRTPEAIQQRADDQRIKVVSLSLGFLN